MRVAPVSGDLLVKLAITLGGVALAVWAVGRARTAAGDALSSMWNRVAGAAEGAYNWAGNAAQRINPASPENLVYSGLNANQWPDGSNTWGSWLYDEIHFENHPEYEFMGPPNPYESGNSGNYTSVMPPVTGSGGAAFGMYPRPSSSTTLTGNGAQGGW